MQQQYNQPRLKLDRGVFLFLICAAIVIIGTVAWGVKAVNAECTVGVTGYAASMTFQGFDAPTICDKMPTTSNQYYDYQGEPVGVEVCSGDLHLPDGNTVLYTVRDSGIIMAVGNQLCKSFQNYGGNQ